MNAARAYQLENDRFKERLDIARRKDQPEEFGMLLTQIQNLKPFCCDEEDKIFIKELYKQARDVLTLFPKLHEKHIFHSLQLSSKELSKHSIWHKQYPTERYQAMPHRIQRAISFISNPFADTSENFKSDITQNFREFFQLLFNDAVILIGPPPCTYNFRAMGSLGREEPCPLL